jgi:hypothetical protein
MFDRVEMLTIKWETGRLPRIAGARRVSVVRLAVYLEAK